MAASPSAIIADHTSQVPVNLSALLSDLGLKFEVSHSLGPDIAGMLKRDPTARAGFRVIVNAADNPRRQRFTTAHEIAHYVLHRDLIEDGVVDDTLYRSKLSAEYERQADRFAAQILLPAQAVREAYRQDKSYAGLARVFGVSDAALRIRLKELRLGP